MKLRTVGAFAQSANFDKVGAEKCESGHLNWYMYLTWIADGDESIICKEVDAEEKNCGDSNDWSHLEVINENCVVDFWL